MDIAPTVTELAGLPRPAGWQGASLIRPVARERLYAFALNYDPVVGIVTKGSKYVYHLDQDGPVLRYDRARDTGERRSIALDANRSGAALQSIAGWTRYNRALYPIQD